MIRFSPGYHVSSSQNAVFSLRNTIHECRQLKQRAKPACGSRDAYAGLGRVLGLRAAGVERPKKIIAHVPPEEMNRYPLDAANYVLEYWQQGRTASYDDFPLLGRGPFGQAIRIVDEADKNFRPFLFVPRKRCMIHRWISKVVNGP